MRSFCSSLLVVRALGAGLTGYEGKRDGLNGNVVFTLQISPFSSEHCRVARGSGETAFARTALLA